MDCGKGTGPDFLPALPLGIVTGMVEIAATVGRGHPSFVLVPFHLHSRHRSLKTAGLLRFVFGHFGLDCGIKIITLVSAFSPHLLCNIDRDKLFLDRIHCFKLHFLSPLLIPWWTTDTTKFHLE